MSRRKFTSVFKTKVVLEVLREERTLGEIAAEHQLNPNQVRSWRQTFLENAASVFDEPKEAKELRRLGQESVEKESAMLKTIGQLTVERDFLQEQVKKKDFQVYLRHAKGNSKLE